MADETFIIAEIGNTHEGSVGLAKCFIKAAAECGVDAVKFQTHIFAAESLPDAPNPPYFGSESRKEYFERTAFTLAQYRELRAYAEECGVEFISSPFSLEAVDLLEELGVVAYKIPSGEVTNVPLLEKIAATGKKVLLSSGMSSWSELDTAVQVLRDHGCQSITLLQCTSEYPCPPEGVGLNVMREMQIRYNLPVGLSDHTLGVAAAVAAVTMGATVIEKHFTLSRKMYGSDARHSVEPDELKQYVAEIRFIEEVLMAPVDKDTKAVELIGMKTIFEKSVVAAKNLAKGSIIQREDIAFKKPGSGIRADAYERVIGRKLTRDVCRDYRFAWDDFGQV